MAKQGRNGGEKTGGRQTGTPNKRTLQWEAFASYCLEGGLQRFQEEMEKLEGKDYVINFLSLLEYHKPKLARTEMTGKDGADLNTPNLSHLTYEQLLKLKSDTK